MNNLHSVNNHCVSWLFCLIKRGKYHHNLRKPTTTEPGRLSFVWLCVLFNSQQSQQIKTHMICSCKYCKNRFSLISDLLSDNLRLIFTTTTLSFTGNRLQRLVRELYKHVQPSGRPLESDSNL